jgi:5'-phosphate synthase pdxT subunit
MLIGVLALQGDFSKHIQAINALGVKTKEVRKPEDLNECDGLIIPGGESTAMIRQMDFIGLRKPLEAFAKQKPLFGTCAGLILMSKHVESIQQPFPMKTLGLLDLTVQRNAFGRQADSFNAPIQLSLDENSSANFSTFFIRAPRIIQADASVQVLGVYNDEPVLVRQGHHLGACFHPELTDDLTIHRYFLSMVSDHLAG